MNLPLTSIVFAPAGTLTEAAGPTALIFEPWMRTVTLGTGAAPVPSMSVAPTRAVNGSSTFPGFSASRAKDDRARARLKATRAGPFLRITFHRSLLDGADDAPPHKFEARA